MFPGLWNNYLITFIPKNNTNEARPIPLVSCFLKIFEKIICIEPSWFCENLNLLINIQYGFRKTRSCMDNLTIPVNHVHQAFFQNEYVMPLSLDIKGAYNKILYVWLSIWKPVVRIGCYEEAWCHCSMLRSDGRAGGKVWFLDL